MSKKQISSIIKELKTRFSSQEIISSSIKIFCISNNLNLNQLNELHEISTYLIYDNALLLDEMNEKFKITATKNLEAIFESLIDFDRKKSEGAVYTPDYIIDGIINYSLSIYQSDHLPTFCDPACGSGGFLIRAIDIFSKRFDIKEEDALKYIKGIDINNESVSCAKIMIELYFYKKNIIIDSLVHNIICADTLLTPAKTICAQLNSTDGIDILSTNPPYVKLQNIDKNNRDQLLNIYPEFAIGSFSFSLLFLIAGYNLLSKNGVLGYITQNNFFTSLAAQNIREYVQKEKCLHTIVDFVHSKIFENASAYTCLIFLTKSRNDILNFKWVMHPNGTLNLNNFSKINLSELNSKKWRLAPQPHLNNISIIDNIGQKLGNIAEIKVGFATLKDTVFLLDNNSNLDIEVEITKPAIKIAELKDENDVQEKTRRIIFPYEKINGKYKLIDEEILRNKFPKAYAYLSQNRDVLADRSGSDETSIDWYKWGRVQCMEAPDNKLLTKTFSSKPNFILDPSTSIFCNGYSVKPKNNQLDIFVLQKLLNSIVMNYYSKLTSFQLEGNYQCFQKNFIEVFGVPTLSEDEINTIKSNQGEDLDRFLCKLYTINYDDVMEIVNR